MNYANSQSGFTLLETLVAIFIFAIALTALATIGVRGTVAARNAQNSAIALNLAQEGLELVENRRDNNFIENVPWTDGFFAECSTLGCYADGTLIIPEFKECVTGGALECPLISKGTATGLYNYKGGDTTIFRRTISVSDPGNPDGGIIVRSTVSWPTGQTEREITSVKYLTPWGGQN